MLLCQYFDFSKAYMSYKEYISAKTMWTFRAELKNIFWTHIIESTLLFCKTPILQEWFFLQTLNKVYEVHTDQCSHKRRKRIVTDSMVCAANLVIFFVKILLLMNGRNFFSYVIGPPLRLQRWMNPIWIVRIICRNHTFICPSIK